MPIYNDTHMNLVVDTLYNVFGESDFSRKDFECVMKERGIGLWKYGYFLSDKSPIKVSRGVFNVSSLKKESKESKKVVSNNTVNMHIEQHVSNVSNELIPERMSNYIRTGIYDTLNNIIKSKQFCPVFISGLSGNGKTLAVQQSCAENNRELYRVNITIETDEDDLLGGFRLYNGETVWVDGPVIKAMKTGGILLLDEIDLGSNKLMCLQPILEGNGIFLKKIGQFVKPCDGFNIIATANTKGQGCESGKFIGTNILNEAFLDRFVCMLCQEYSKETVEKKILIKQLQSLNCFNDEISEIVDKLVLWASATRKTYSEGGVDDLISTRRLVHIIKLFAVLSNNYDKLVYNCMTDCIKLCIARFDTITQESFITLWMNIADVTFDKL